MAKNNEETVAVPVSVLQEMQERLARLEHAENIRKEVEANPHQRLLDPAFEAWKIDVSRPAKVRTQEIADKRYGTDGQRFRCKLVSITADGKPGPRIDEHPELVISANSDLEAKARWQDVCGVRGFASEYRVEVNAV